MSQLPELPEGSFKPINSIQESALGWEVPVESVPLPSKGKLYNKENFFYDKELVQIKAMTAKEEDILVSRSYTKDGSTLDRLIASCTGAKYEDVVALLAGDKNALAVSIRVTGYGADYVADVTCPKCFKSSEYTFNLGEMEIKNLDVDPVQPGENAFTYTLPVSRKNVVFKILDGNDQQELLEETRILQEKLGNSFGSVTRSICKRIISIDGVTDRDQIARFVRIMPALDSKKFREYFDSIEPSLDTQFNFICPKCNSKSNVTMPIGKNFFWPA